MEKIYREEEKEHDEQERGYTSQTDAYPLLFLK
jgi:hypothetical protein